MSNIVVFGATQAGKTTLLGYLASKALSDKEFTKAINQNKKIISNTLGEEFFSSDMIFPSFISMDRDELRKFDEASENSRGTTKRIHRKSIRVELNKRNSITENIVFIDTIGYNPEISEKYMQMFEGDIGIAVVNVIDLKNLIELTNKYEITPSDCKKRKLYNQKIFEPLNIWCLYREPKHLIVVLSRVDEIDFDLAIISDCISFLNDKLREYSLHDIPVVPISIPPPKMSGNIYLRKEKNVYDHCEELPAKGTLHRFITHLRKLVSESEPEFYKDFKFASIDKIAKARVNNQPHYAIRVKVLNGDLNKYDTCLLGPLTHRGASDHIYLRGKIKSLKFEDGIGLVSELKENNIGGVIFSELYPDNKKTTKALIELKDCKLSRTSLLMADRSYKNGDVLQFKIREDELPIETEESLKLLLPNVEVQLYWFGKMIPMSLIEKKRETLIKEDESEIVKYSISLTFPSSDVRNKAGEFAMPTQQDSQYVINEDFLIGIPDPVGTLQRHEHHKYTHSYINAILHDIKRLSDYKKFTFCSLDEPLLYDINYNLLPDETNNLLLQFSDADDFFVKIKRLKIFLKENAIGKYSLELRKE